MNGLDLPGVRLSSLFWFPYKSETGDGRGCGDRGVDKVSGETYSHPTEMGRMFPSREVAGLSKGLYEVGLEVVTPLRVVD